MKAAVKTFDDKSAGSIELADDVFGLRPRADILQRVVTWQLAKARQGTHKTKQRAEIRGSGSKIYRQKGTGRARHSNRKAPIFRGGGVAFGPHPRDHAIKLPKKVRQLGLKTALSVKQAAGELIVLDEAKLDAPKTRLLVQKLEKFGWSSILLVDGAELDANLARAAKNIVGIKLLPSNGANVYDILHRETLVLTKAAVAQLEARLK